MRRTIAPFSGTCDALKVSDEKPKLPGGVTGKGFMPGKPSANPGGRPKGYERRLREVVDAMRAEDPTPDPEGAVDKDGRPLKIPAFDAIVKQAVIDAVAGDRYARDFIADRLMGKPKVNVDIKTQPDRRKADLSGMSVEEKRNLLTAYETMQNLTGTETPPDDDLAPTEH